MQHATGTFAVKMAPAAQTSAGGVALARMTVTKAFSGGMTATAEGDMLTAAGAVPESAAYVLIERVTGSIDGKAGSFAFMHHATMDRGKPDQHISIVPDSGSGGLAGISGAMTMRIDDGGVHHYDLAYRLPEQR
ncbi:DUF3224 domain-containing protein [Sandarakinorhabdus sp. DWP1-3-1]|uniref:DUF3224 domain-containing protein n=1 Tax=Sandarakinorhabdus sp. DWP1-3-1 TaxID=2804627 RepID=UPI003CED9EB1